MTSPEERKQEVPDALPRARRKAGRSAQTTDTDRGIAEERMPDREDFPADEPGSSGLPPTGKIKEKIIRRVYQIIDECNDPKKLMDAYEAMTKLEERIGPRESVFDVVERNLREETAG